jgi:type IV pilus assembly protein PilB
MLIVKKEGILDGKNEAFFTFTSTTHPMIKFKEDEQKSKLAELRRREAEQLAQLLAERYGLAYVDLTQMLINPDALHVVPEEMAREAHMAVYKKKDRTLEIAILSPNNKKTQAQLDDLKQRGFSLTVAMTSDEALKEIWERYKERSSGEATHAGLFNISQTAIEELRSQIHSVVDVSMLIKNLFGESRVYRTSRVLEIVLAGAMALEASDVHLEPGEKDVRLRFRLDGILTDIEHFDLDTYKLLLSRIKLLSGLVLNVGSEAQDGRFSVRIGEDDVEIRTSVLPERHSESIVMRLLNPKNIALDITDLGIEPYLFSLIEQEIAKPNGMLVTTGPTGSGKTTTLYAFLRRIHNPEIKIITIEDPVEYVVRGLVQTQVRKGYSFASGLRAAMRQDPDVIMVGEIRDEETAEIAINASLTGHLVFSTLHTNSAAGTFPRLLELGVNPRVISSAMNMSLAQRLVRRLCPACKKEVPLEGAHKETIDVVLKSIVRDDMTPAQRTSVWEAVGCDDCGQIGYKGRVGLYEAVLVDETIDEILKTNPSEADIRRVAAHQGILTMRQEGVLKILSGITTFAEVNRVVDMKEDVEYEKMHPVEHIQSDTRQHKEKQIEGKESPKEKSLLLSNL